MSDQTPPDSGFLKKAAADADNRTREPEFGYILKDLYARLDERDHWDDEVTRFLLYANGGGVAVTMTFAGILVGRVSDLGQDLMWLVPMPIITAATFTYGISIVGNAIFFANKYATANRKRFRTLANQYINDPTLSYADVFLTLGTLSNKREGFTKRCRKSLNTFISGVVLGLASIVVAAYVISGHPHAPRPTSATPPPVTASPSAVPIPAMAPALPSPPNP